MSPRRSRGSVTDDFTQRQINEGLYLYKRATSKRWQARIKRTENEWFAMSCGTSDFEGAKKVAIERQKQMRDAQSSGLVDVSRKFADVARLTIKHLDNEVEAGVGKAVNRDYKQVINRYLIPALGKYQIHHIDHKALVELDAYRNKLLDRQPNRSTLNTHNAALRRVFKTAIDRGYMLPLQVPQLVNRGRAPRARPYFDPADYRRVSRNLREFAGTGHKTAARQLRDLLWDYALILANTGMRTGEEALNLKWNQIKRTKEVDLKTVDRETIDILKFSVTGKKRPRTLICRDVDGSVTTPLNRIQSRFPELANLKDKDLFKVNDYVFRTVDGTRPRHERLVKAFKVFLTKYGLLKDKEDQIRTLYSLRHTYATTQLRNGVTWDDLAIQMGTSRAMLERHYSKFKVEDRAADFSGLSEKRKIRASKEKSQLEEAKEVIKTLEQTIIRLTNTIEALTKEKV
jgi:integrase